MSDLRERLEEVRQWMLEHIDGGEEVKGYDSILSGYIKTVEDAQAALSAMAAMTITKLRRSEDARNDQCLRIPHPQADRHGQEQRVQRMVRAEWLPPASHGLGRLGGDRVKAKYIIEALEAMREAEKVLINFSATPEQQTAAYLGLVHASSALLTYSGIKDVEINVEVA